MAKPKSPKIPPQAVGTFEAAALMGVHFTLPKRMAERGRLTSRVVTDDTFTDEPTRAYAIYDSGECEADYASYQESVDARGGKSERRPRAWLHLRPDVVKYLSTVPPIAFDDAIGVGEASKILGVHYSLVARLVRDGKVVGRIAWSGRGAKGAKSSRLYILSRKSCLQNVKAVRAAEAEGTKRGRKRKKIA